MHTIQIIGTLAREAAGPSYSVRRLAEALAERGNVSEVMSLGTPGLQSLGRAASRVLAADRGRLAAATGLLPSRDLARAINAAAKGGAVLHGHGVWRMLNVYPARAARRHGAALVVSPRGMLSEAALAFSRRSKRAFWHLVQKRALATAACLHATSEAEAADIRAAGLMRPVAIIPNGIDVPTLADVLAAKSARRGEGPRTLLFLGRLHPIKRIDRLLEAWARVERSHPAWRLRIVGPSEGVHGGDLAALAASLQLERVSFEAALHGADKDAALRQAEVLVLTSESENFGMVVAEALANGTPVISTKGAPWAGLAVRRCGWWIDHGVDPLAAALVEAMGLSRAEIDRMGAAGREWMASDFSWERVAADMEAVYLWAMGQGPRPATVVT